MAVVQALTLPHIGAYDNPAKARLQRVWHRRRVIARQLSRKIKLPVFILIAEDNLAQRAYLCEPVAREFAARQPILEAADGETVVKFALAERSRLCVLDIQMPGLSGVKVAKAIWKNFPEARIIFWAQ